MRPMCPQARAVRPASQGLYQPWGDAAPASKMNTTTAYNHAYRYGHNYGYSHKGYGNGYGYRHHARSRPTQGAGADMAPYYYPAKREGDGHRQRQRQHEQRARPRHHSPNYYDSHTYHQYNPHPHDSTYYPTPPPSPSSSPPQHYYPYTYTEHPATPPGKVPSPSHFLQVLTAKDAKTILADWETRRFTDTKSPASLKSEPEIWVAPQLPEVTEAEEEYIQTVDCEWSRMRLRKLRETQEGFLRYLDKNRDLLIKEAEIEEREGRMRERLENGEWIDEEGDEEEEEEEEDEEVVDETEVSKLVGMVKSKMQKAKKRAGTKLEGRFFPNA